MLEFIKDVKSLTESSEFRSLSKIERDNLRSFKNATNAELIERVAKVMDDIQIKNFTRLAGNGFETATK